MTILEKKFCLALLKYARDRFILIQPENKMFKIKFKKLIND